MMFDLPDECLLEDAVVQKLQEDLDVTISIKPKARYSNRRWLYEIKDVAAAVVVANAVFICSCWVYRWVETRL